MPKNHKKSGLDFRLALDAAGERPADSAEREPKRRYAEKLSNAIALLLADALKKYSFPASFKKATIESKEEKVKAGGTSYKKVDVVYSTPRLGVALTVSIKTQNFQDANRTNKLYCHNLTRIIDQELQGEASALHDRFPYAVLVGAVFLPVNACTDAPPSYAASTAPGRCTSFAEYAQRLRAIQGRRRIKSYRDERRFEKVYIGIYWPDDAADGGHKRGDVLFFDTASVPPKWGMPTSGLLTFDEFLAQSVALTKRRNSPARAWGELGPDHAAALAQEQAATSLEADGVAE